VLEDETGGDWFGPCEVDPIVGGREMTWEVEVAENRQRQSPEVRQIDATYPLQEEGAVIEAVFLLVGKGEDESAEQKEEDDGLMASDEETQRGADEKVEHFVRQDAGEVVKDDGESGDSSQGVELVESPISLAVWISLFRPGHATSSLP
jgi:hypothetical protein